MRLSALAFALGASLLPACVSQEDVRKPLEERYAAIRAGLKEIRVTGARKQ